MTYHLNALFSIRVNSDDEHHVVAALEIGKFQDFATAEYERRALMICPTTIVEDIMEIINRHHAAPVRVQYQIGLTASEKKGLFIGT